MSHQSTVAFNQAVYRRVLEAARCGSAEELADKLEIARTTAYEWQRGERLVPQKHLELAAAKFGKALAWFYQVEMDSPGVLFNPDDDLGAVYLRELPPAVKQIVMIQLKALHDNRSESSEQSGGSPSSRQRKHG